MNINKFENVFNYNRACEMLHKMMVDTTTIKHSGNFTRYGFYDVKGNKTAEYNEKKQELKVYNYDTHCSFANTELSFPY